MNGWDDGRRREKKELKRGEETRRELREKFADRHLLEDGLGYNWDAALNGAPLSRSNKSPGLYQ